MYLNKFDVFHASIIALVLAVCAVAIPAMIQAPTGQQPVSQTRVNLSL